MIWEKRGKLCDCESLNLNWCKLNITTPIPYLLDDGRLRIYASFCDADNRGRMGYIDLNASNPSEILGYSKKPLLDIGKPGSFDDNGLMTSSLFEEDGKIYVFYSGFQKHIKVPYVSLTGVAVSSDGGNSFERVHEVPLLERRDGELFVRSSGEVIKVNDGYRIYYASGENWIQREDSTAAPKYMIKSIDSTKIDSFTEDGRLVISLKDDEYGLTTPQVLKTDHGYQMFYSVRSLSKGYRMGYAESVDGICWERQDEKMELDVSDCGWDSEMICFGKTITYDNKTYLFYCGNHYGRDGIGYAVLKN